jgi:hypothetical protein
MDTPTSDKIGSIFRTFVPPASRIHAQPLAQADEFIVQDAAA